jgi:hypothetical protein
MNKESKDKRDDERVRIPNARNNEDEKIAKRAKYESQELSVVLPTAASSASAAAFPTTYVVSGVGTVVHAFRCVDLGRPPVQAFFARFSLRWTGLTGKFVMAFT